MSDHADIVRRADAERQRASRRGGALQERGAMHSRVTELEAALRGMLNGQLLSMPGVNPDGTVSTSSMAETLARAALGEDA
jgi:hypothetical protein